MNDQVMSDSVMQDRAVLSCRNLGKSYDEGPQSVVVLHDLQLELHPGERVAIVGSSGSGKSTLLNMLGGLDTPSTGSVWLAGEELSALNEKQRGLLRNRALGFVYRAGERVHAVVDWSHADQRSAPASHRAVGAGWPRPSHGAQTV